MFRVLMQDGGPGAAISRRRVLADGGRGLVAFALLGGAITACGTGAPSGPDPLEEQAELARQDSALATAAAVGAPPALARAFTEVAAERSRHATALVEGDRPGGPHAGADEFVDHHVDSCRAGTRPR